MFLVDNGGNQDPALNLALEEYLVRHTPNGADTLLFYVNQRSVVIGRNQVPYVEMGLQAVQRRQAAVVRRISGGGTVYHDTGNLNFCWIQGRRDDPFPSPAEAVQAVLESLRDLGLPARLNKRNDILLEDRKITGIAQYRTRDKCLTHGTLLVAADLEAMEDLLRPDCDVPASRGRRSVRSKVTNLTRYLPALTIGALQERLVQGFAAFHGNPVPLTIDTSGWAQIAATASAKYRSWDWNVGRAPGFSMRRSTAFAWGSCEALIDIRRGIVTRLAFALPKGAPGAIEQLASCLEGERYHPRTVATRIHEAGPGHRRVGAGWRRLAEWICPSWYWWG
mgnify:FL=1